MSSMRSASSSTRISTCRGVTARSCIEVEQAARGRNQNIDAVRHRPDLLADRHAADGERHRHFHVPAIGPEAVDDLAGQLARRAQHQHAAALALRADAILRQMIEDRQREGCGFAGAGLRNADDVAAREHVRNGLRLDRSGGFVALFDERAGDGLSESEFKKSGQNSIFHAARTPGPGIGRGRFARGSKDIPRVQGCRLCWKVLAGRKPLHEVQSDFRSRGPLATQRTESASMALIWTVRASVSRQIVAIVNAPLTLVANETIVSRKSRAIIGQNQRTVATKRRSHQGGYVMADIDTAPRVKRQASPAAVTDRIRTEPRSMPPSICRVSAIPSRPRRCPARCRSAAIRRRKSITDSTPSSCPARLSRRRRRPTSARGSIASVRPCAIPAASRRSIAGSFAPRRSAMTPT